MKVVYIHISLQCPLNTTRKNGNNPTVLMWLWKRHHGRWIGQGSPCLKITTTGGFQGFLFVPQVVQLGCGELCTLQSENVHRQRQRKKQINKSTDVLSGKGPRKGKCSRDLVGVTHSRWQRGPYWLYLPHQPPPHPRQSGLIRPQQHHQLGLGA